LIGKGHMNLPLTAVVAWCGIIGGDCVLYSIGRSYGLEITRVPFIGKHVTKARILWAKTLFQRWGTWVIAVGRMFAGVRGAVVVAAGRRGSSSSASSWPTARRRSSAAAVPGAGVFVRAKLDVLLEKIRGGEMFLLLATVPVAFFMAAYVLWRRRRHKTLSDLALEKVARSVETPVVEK